MKKTIFFVSIFIIMGCFYLTDFTVIFEDISFISTSHARPTDGRSPDSDPPGGSSGSPNGPGGDNSGSDGDSGGSED